MPHALNLGRIGVNVRHDSAFEVLRPRGSGDVVFLHFRTAILLHDDTGETVHAPGACILYTPPHRQFYRGPAGAGFDHDWFHLSGRQVSRLARRWGLPENHVFHPTRTVFIAPAIAELQRERAHAEPDWPRAVALQVELFLLKLAREFRRAGPRDGVLGGAPAEHPAREAFQRLRARIESAPQQPWTVATLAREVNLSPSRFAVVYKSIFGASPIEDLLEARLAMAKNLLTNSSLAVHHVAEACGFANVYYFSRMFKSRIGVPPSVFAREFADA